MSINKNVYKYIQTPNLYSECDDEIIINHLHKCTVR